VTDARKPPSEERRENRARLMALAQQGDRDAYRRLLSDIGPALARFFRRKVADPHDVEDLCQETLIALHRARHTYDPARPLEPWLFAIARNVATDHLRRRLSRTPWEVLMETPPDQPAPPEGALGPRLSHALDQLPPAQREAFEMLKLDGLTVQDAATRAGTTVGALKVRAHRAYKTLKAILGA
jgi:RNA polymerase sigma-70 factor (ECF subfamily)